MFQLAVYPNRRNLLESRAFDAAAAAERKLMFVPVSYVVLYIWGLVRFFLFIFSPDPEIIYKPHMEWLTVMNVSTNIFVAIQGTAWGEPMLLGVVSSCRLLLLKNCYFIPLARAVLFFRNLPQLITRTMLQADHYFTPTLQGQAMVVTMVKRTFPNVTRKYSIFLKSIIYAGFFFFSGSWFFRTRIHQFSVLLFPYQAVYGSNEKILALLQLLERQCAING